ncbi:hypothetical protein [Pseudomonas sp. Marseille-Q8238]
MAAIKNDWGKSTGSRWIGAITVPRAKHATPRDEVDRDTYHLFAHVPVESLVHAHQTEYYAAINDSTQQADSAPFIVFMLSMLRDAILSIPPKSHPKSRSCSSMWSASSAVRRCKLR